jgi:hypothetical protein
MKKILLISILFLCGCAPTKITLRSDPPGAIISGDGIGGDFIQREPVYRSLPRSQWTDSFKNGGCMNVKAGKASWSDGSVLDMPSIPICNKSENVYVFRKPAPSTTPVPAAQPRQTTGMEIEDAKRTCLDLGFKVGTEGFGKCVLKISK